MLDRSLIFDRRHSIGPYRLSKDPAIIESCVYYHNGNIQVKKISHLVGFVGTDWAVDLVPSAEVSRPRLLA